MLPIVYLIFLQLADKDDEKEVDNFERIGQHLFPKIEKCVIEDYDKDTSDTTTGKKISIQVWYRYRSGITHNTTGINPVTGLCLCLILITMELSMEISCKVLKHLKKSREKILKIS